MLAALKSIGEARLPHLYAKACDLFDRLVARNPQSEVNLLPLLVAPGETACDVGANHGLFTFFLLRQNVRVLAFEPNPRLVRIMRYRFPDAIRRGDLRLFECALSDAEGEATLHVPKGFSPLATLDGAMVSANVEMENVAVPLRRLDAAVREEIAFIKLDVEGHEARVLLGADHLLRANLPTLLVEAEERHRPGAVASVAALLAPLGYAGLFFEAGQPHPLSAFDAGRHQRRDALNAAGSKVLPGHVYINNFLFVARADAKARLAARWPQIGPALGL
ncbi:FkbM family methyltransferase [Roseixanthobacter liquoris]|uniref:FkbM family methyltransferase n=1 Tax=Roseixanthobacter liquoris TaxID=3119921 RepID=UPI00372B092A